MEVLGKVSDGVIVIEGGVILPEGAAVRIVYEATEPWTESLSIPDRIQFPLIRTGKPGTLHLTNSMIHEIFDDEDLYPRR